MGVHPILLAVLATVAFPSLAANGKTTYGQTCQACHATGVANAPRIGDKAAWAPRAALGLDLLAKSVLEGKGAMPPKGGNPKLGEGEIRAAITYMLEASR